MIYLVIYAIICIIESIIFKRIHDNGYVEKVVEKHYGNDAWKEKYKFRLPEINNIYPLLFVTFFITSPIVWILLIFSVFENIFKKLFAKEEA